MIRVANRDLELRAREFVVVDSKMHTSQSVVRSDSGVAREALASAAATGSVQGARQDKVLVADCVVWDDVSDRNCLPGKRLPLGALTRQEHRIAEICSPADGDAAVVSPDPIVIVVAVAEDVHTIVNCKTRENISPNVAGVTVLRTNHPRLRRDDVLVDVTDTVTRGRWLPLDARSRRRLISELLLSVNHFLLFGDFQHGCRGTPNADGNCKRHSQNRTHYWMSSEFGVRSEG